MQYTVKDEKPGIVINCINTWNKILSFLMLVEITTRNYVMVIKYQFKNKNDLENFPNKTEECAHQLAWW